MFSKCKVSGVQETKVTKLIFKLKKKQRFWSFGYISWLVLFINDKKEQNAHFHYSQLITYRVSLYWG